MMQPKYYFQNARLLSQMSLILYFAFVHHSFNPFLTNNFEPRYVCFPQSRGTQLH